jgi:hypothetical protein
MYLISYQYIHFILLHGIRGLGLGFLPPLLPLQPPPPPSRHWLPRRRPARLIQPSRGGPSPLLSSRRPPPSPPTRPRPCTVFPTGRTPAAHGTGPWRTVRAWRPSHGTRHGRAPPLGGSSATRLPDAGAGRPRASLLTTPGGPARRPAPAPAPAAWAWPPTLRGARTPPLSSSFAAAAASSPRSGPGMAMAASCFGPPQRRRRRRHDHGWTPCAPSPAKGGPAAATSTCTLPPPIVGALLSHSSSLSPCLPLLPRAATRDRARRAQDSVAPGRRPFPAARRRGRPSPHAGQALPFRPAPPLPWLHACRLTGRGRGPPLPRPPKPPPPDPRAPVSALPDSRACRRARRRSLPSVDHLDQQHQVAPPFELLPLPVLPTPLARSGTGPCSAGPAPSLSPSSPPSLVLSLSRPSRPDPRCCGLLG